MTVTAPTALRVSRVLLEHNDDPSTLGTATPRLSWAVKTREPGWQQQAYEIGYTPDGGEEQTARVESAEQLLVPWPLEPLTSRARGTVTIKAYGPDGAVAESDPVAIGVGLLEASDWQARFVGPAGQGLDDPAPIVFTSAEIAGEIASARLYVTALGWYRFAINGTRVGDEELAPGWTAYHSRLRYQSFDVTDLLTSGENRLQAVLGNGWFRGQMTWDLHRAHYGDKLALLAQLEITKADGTTQVIKTDETWQACASGILADDFYDGQRTDLSVSLDPAGKDAKGVELVEWDLPTLFAPYGPPIRVVETLPVKEIITSPSGKTIIDFGQNLVGWVRLKTRGQAGAEVIIRHAEVLEHGELGVRPLRKAKATDSYLLSGGDDACEPLFTFHGFRYAEVTGVDDLDPSRVEAVAISSDLRRTGTWASSHDQLNQLHQNVVWGMRGNFLDVPTDCPQRDERLGWTGDIQVFSPTASYLFHTNGFLSNWLADLAVDQWEDGSVPSVIPNVLGETHSGAAAAAWGDAAAVVPTVLWQRFADRDLLGTQFPSMKAWVDKLISLATDDGLWLGGFQYGDWLDPTAPPENAAKAQVSPDVVATAHLIRSAGLVADAAELLGKDDEAKHYREVSERSRQAFVDEFVTGSGRVLGDCQTAYAMALVWDFLPEDRRDHAGKRLAELVEQADFKVSTGFVGTPLILDALELAGRPDLAWKMITATENPSWLYPVTMGATTIWERWDSMLPDGTINPGQMTSFNHYAFGAVADWMHRRLAGLAPAEPGYRKITIAPIVPDGLDWCEASYDSGYGPIKVRWERSGAQVQLTASIPPGVTADVRLPDGTEHQVSHGDHAWSAVPKTKEEA
ncbi:family 78 glycoside hydrolase catalytic domain [Microlunatus parietis]|uniref:alpha-L-rhamnosidase n=1 Tax=Microlunatus parietis TaxID=682979 RepID=A0A7Y9I4Y7_9ACTN|nr:family 78 glycoside hydrolase catalytic domain [Microlunatus parietis]NYE70178.1 alpha-L-rhamnosidase [Microlunatus parietis]